MLGPGNFDAEIPRQRFVGGDLESGRELVLEILDMSKTLVEDDGIIDLVEHVRDCAVSFLSLIKTRINSALLEANADHVVREEREPRIWRGIEAIQVLHETSQCTVVRSVWKTSRQSHIMHIEWLRIRKSLSTVRGKDVPALVCCQ